MVCRVSFGIIIITIHHHHHHPFNMNESKYNGCNRSFSDLQPSYHHSNPHLCRFPKERSYVAPLESRENVKIIPDTQRLIIANVNPIRKQSFVDKSLFNETV